MKFVTERLALGPIHCYKTAIFTFMFAVFLPKSTVVIPIFQTNGRYVGIIFPVSILAIISM